LKDKLAPNKKNLRIKHFHTLLLVLLKVDGAKDQGPKGDIQSPNST
jgi:hypothetical protein